MRKLRERLTQTLYSKVLGFAQASQTIAQFTRERSMAICYTIVN